MEVGGAKVNVNHITTVFRVHEIKYTSNTYELLVHELYILRTVDVFFQHVSVFFMFFYILASEKFGCDGNPY